MNTKPSLDPFQAPAFADQQPRPARLEITERHPGEKYTRDQPIIPNGVRVNGMQLLCPIDDPIVVRDVVVGGTGDASLVVTLRLQVRAVSLGDPAAEPAGAPVGGGYAVVEVPLPDPDLVETVSVPYAVVNGQKLQVGGQVRVLGVVLGKDLVVVELPLVCRSVLFDDEPTGV